MFDVAIGPVDSTADSFLVRVIRGEAGEASTCIMLDLQRLSAARVEVQDAVLSSSVPTRRVLPEKEATLQSVGRVLFTALLGTAEVHTCYRGALALADQRGEDLRVVVRLESATLATLPWESMYDAARGDYVCLRDQVVRHVPVPSVPAPLQVQAPLHLLVATASPRGLAPLDVDRERGHLERALGPLTQEGLFTVDWVEQAGWADLQEALMRRPCHCLHFIGHGNFDEETDQGELALVGRDGRADLIEANRFVSLLRTGRPMPRLVVLNSCLGAAGGESDLFAGTASTLVRGGVSGVVAMQYEITDAAAAEFARGFYAGVAHGRGLDAAVAAGRVAILGINGRTLEWVTPVLYLRGDNPQLFTICAADTPRDAPAPAALDRPPSSGWLGSGAGIATSRRAAGDGAEVEALHRAERLRERQRWVEAEAAFREAIRLAPGNSAAHFGLGSAQWGQRRPVEAEAAFREAIRLAPTHPVPRCGLGSALRDQGRPVEAEAAFREAIRLAPENAAAYYGLGSALRDQRRAAEAEAAFREAIRIAPEHPLAYRGLGHALSDLGRDAEARACHREAATRESVRRGQGVRGL